MENEFMLDISLDNLKEVSPEETQEKRDEGEGDDIIKLDELDPDNLPEEVEELLGVQKGEEEEEETSEGEETEEDTPVHRAYNVMTSLGVIDELEEFDGSEETLVEALKNRDAQVAQNFVAAAPPLAQKLLQYVFTAEDLNKDSLREFYDTYLNEIDTQLPESYSNVEEAKEFLINYYKNEKGLNPKVAASAVEILEDEDENGQSVLEEANKHLKTMKSSSKTDEIIQRELEAKQKREQQQAQFVDNFKNSLQESTFTDTRRKQIEKEVFTNTTVEKVNQIFNSPKSLVQLANVLMYYDAQKDEFDFKKLVEKGFTEEAKNIKKSIITDNFNTGGSTSKGKKGNPDKQNKISLDDLKPIL